MPHQTDGAATARRVTPNKTKPAPRRAAKPGVAPKNGAAATRPTALSAKGAKFIGIFEGFSSKMYNDPAEGRHATIGFGHLIHRGPINGSEPAEFKKGISHARGLQLLQQDADTAAAAVRRLVKVPLNQAQFDALVSFTFNCGAGALEQSTLLKKLNAGNYDAVPTELKKWVKAGRLTLPGLVRRRIAEGELFARGDYVV